MPETLTRPGTVWDPGNTTPTRQITDRAIGATRTDTALTPELARQIITTYTAPGDTVCDPNPGPGFVLAEALRTGRNAIGLAPQPGWGSAWETHLDLASSVSTAASVLDSVDDPRAAELPDAVDLVLTGLRHNPCSDPNQVLVELYEDLNAAADWVWPGGHIVITCRPWRHHGRMLDLPGAIREATDAIGLIPVAHYVSLSAPMRRNPPRPSNVSCRGERPGRTGIHGLPTGFSPRLDVLVFRTPSHEPSFTSPSMTLSEEPSSPRLTRWCP